MPIWALLPEMLRVTPGARMRLVASSVWNWEGERTRLPEVTFTATSPPEGTRLNRAVKSAAERASRLAAVSAMVRPMGLPSETRVSPASISDWAWATVRVKRPSVLSAVAPAALKVESWVAVKPAWICAGVAWTVTRLEAVAATTMPLATSVVASACGRSTWVSEAMSSVTPRLARPVILAVVRDWMLAAVSVTATLSPIGAASVIGPSSAWARAIPERSIPASDAVMTVTPKVMISAISGAVSALMLAAWSRMEMVAPAGMVSEMTPYMASTWATVKTGLPEVMTMELTPIAAAAESWAAERLPTLAALSLTWPDWPEGSLVLLERSFFS